MGGLVGRTSLEHDYHNNNGAQHSGCGSGNGINHNTGTASIGGYHGTSGSLGGYRRWQESTGYILQESDEGTIVQSRLQRGRIPSLGWDGDVQNDCLVRQAAASSIAGL